MSKSHVTTSQAASPVPAFPLPRPQESSDKRGSIAEVMTKAAEGAPFDHEAKCLMIAEAAHCAERRGLAPGGELPDWLDAEAQVAAFLH